MKLSDILQESEASKHHRKLCDELLGKPFFIFYKRVHFANGESFSVQANSATYCAPRIDSNDVDVYTHVEVGFPSKRMRALYKYAENRCRPKDTVYAYVPVRIVLKLIEQNGGLAGE